MKTEKFDALDRLLLTKAFRDLTGKEKADCKDAGIDEHAYQAMRTLILEAGNMRERPVQATVRKDLTGRFRAKNQTWTNVVLSAKIPAYLNVAALAVLAIVLWYLLPAKEIIIEKPTIVELPGRTDTLFLATSPDTVFIEKLVKVEIPVVTVNPPESTPEKSLKGSTLADQKELRKLLVSTK